MRDLLTRMRRQPDVLGTPAVLIAGAVVVLLLLGLNAVVLFGDRGEAPVTTSVMEGASTPPPAAVTPGSDASAAPSPGPTDALTDLPAPATEPAEAGAPAAPPTSGPAAIDPAAPPAGAGDVQATLPAGTCLVVPTRPTHVRSVSPIDCAEEHTGEVFISVVLTQPADAPYPGREALEQDSRTLCQGQPFESYVGVPYTETHLFAFVLAPTEESWAAGDRDVSCFLSDITGPMVGSQRDTGG